ncbi:MAG TPA: hypothetical protein VK914_13380 [bacterium]|jgi:hypothetical protein|nr:hypothetical protein [bacterium]
MATKTITFLLPQDVGREVLEAAKEERSTVSELLREWTRQHKALRTYKKSAARIRKLVRQKGLTEKDFGGPFGTIEGR